MAQEPDLDGFSLWLLNRGRAASTAALYVRNVGYCLEDPRSLVARVARDGLAPTTRRHHLAALRAWARYTSDAELAEVLNDLKLPPAVRVSEKLALELSAWRRLLAHIATLRRPPEVRAVCMMIGIRGFRVGDILRVTRKEARAGAEQGVLNFRGKGNRRLSWSVAPFGDELALLCERPDWGHVRDLVTSARGDEDAVQEAARQRIQKAIRRACIEAGLDPCGPHILRRTYAWHIKERFDNDPVKLQKHMGWAKIETAMQYIDQSERAELDALAEELHDELRP